LTTLIDPRDPLQIDFIVDLLRMGEAIALPTETVYGLAAIATDERALARVFELKARPRFDPLIVHVLNLRHAESYVSEISPLHRKLCDQFWPGPLTLLFRKSERVPDLCTAGSPWVAVRSPKHAVFRFILERLKGDALAAPSANRFASISPTRSKDVVQELGPHGLQAVVEGGLSEHGLESTVVKIHSDNEIEVVRPGALAVEELAKVLGSGVRIRIRDSGTGVEGGPADEELRESPGQHRVHYAPSKPLYLIEPGSLSHFLASRSGIAERSALLEVFPSGIDQGASWAHREVLSQKGSWAEAASKLFSTLRHLDQSNGIEAIVALTCSEDSLGLAIMDRLRRASLTPDGSRTKTV
jgi:L-threonylcarbamoyladenylate synthase